jgi:uncharacterized protein
LNLADVNVLLVAFSGELEGHAVCKDWLDTEMAARRPFAVSSLVLGAVVRLATNPKVLSPPAKLEETLDFCNSLLEHPDSVATEPGLAHWRIFSQLCIATNARGNLITDAWFAALAIEHDCTFITFDRDFRKFAGLKTASPLIAR